MLSFSIFAQKIFQMNSDNQKVLRLSTKNYTELLSLFAIRCTMHRIEKRKNPAYSVVHHPSNKRTTNTVSQIEAEIQLVS